MYLRELYKTGIEKFKNAEFEYPDLESRAILLSILDKDITCLYTSPEKHADINTIEKFREFVERRLRGEPFSYIFGKKEFFSRDYIVNPDVLIPRPETELLVEKSLKIISGFDNPVIMDMGTGSGCIAVSISAEIKRGKIYATDISFPALLTAKANYLLNRTNGNIRFINADFLNTFCFSSFDIIISNPPYISEEEFKDLDNGVKKYEPVSALLGGKDGLEHISRIIGQASNLLKDGGWCILEIGYGQSRKVEKIFLDNGYCNIQKFRDLNKIDRVIKAQWKK